MPTVSIITSAFLRGGQTLAKTLGYPDLAMVVVPHPFEILPNDTVVRLAEEKLDEIVGKLMVGHRGNLAKD